MNFVSGLNEAWNICSTHKLPKFEVIKIHAGKLFFSIPHLSHYTKQLVDLLHGRFCVRETMIGDCFTLNPVKRKHTNKCWDPVLVCLFVIVVRKLILYIFCFRVYFMLFSKGGNIHTWPVWNVYWQKNDPKINLEMNYLNEWWMWY